MKKLLFIAISLAACSCMTYRESLLKSGYTQETKNIFSHFDKFRNLTMYENIALQNPFGGDGIMKIYALRGEGRKYLRVKFSYMGSSWIYFNKVIIADGSGNTVEFPVDASTQKTTDESSSGSFMHENADIPLDEEKLPMMKKIFSLKKDIAIRFAGRGSKDHDLKSDELADAVCEIIDFYKGMK